MASSNTSTGGNAAATSSNTTTASHNWRNPSAAHRQKYSLNPLPENFEPTPQEQHLLEVYDVIRARERHAARLKEEAARAKLEAANVEFQQKLAAPHSQKKKNKRKRDNNNKPAAESNVQYSEDEDDDDDIDDSDLEDDEEQEPTLHDRREAKLEQMRQENEEKKALAKQQLQQQDEALREQLLGEAVAPTLLDDGGVVIRKKQRTMADYNNDENPAASSLIQNMTALATPPHDFSEKLELTRVKGTVLFPASPDEFKWQPPEGVFSPNDGAFVVPLPDFDVSRAETGQGNNTLAIKFMAPSDAKRFSMNIAAPNHNDFESVLFHFNPRQRERGGQLVVNDKNEGIWGQAIAVPLSQVPIMFGQKACTLLIQINGEGFDIFIENRHCARLEHRKELPEGNTNLVLQFPSTDDRGSPENWTVYKVWWGNKAILAKGDVSGVPGVNSFDSLHPRKIFLSGLGKIFTVSEVEIRKAELERAFRAYGGDQGVNVIVPTNATYAFVECASESLADKALQDMANSYRMNRARRSRHDALQEARAAKEKGAARAGPSGWD